VVVLVPREQVGPLEVFVSRFNMPEDIAQHGYDAAGDMWVSDDKEVCLSTFIYSIYFL
jgi:hypothetical protein